MELRVVESFGHSVIIRLPRAMSTLIAGLNG